MSPEELAGLVKDKVSNEYGASDYESWTSDNKTYGFAHLVEKALKEIFDEQGLEIQAKKTSLKDELNLLVREYYKKYPDGEFSFSPMYSFDETHVEGVLCFDWKSKIYHIENEPIEDVIKLIEGLKK